MSVFRPPTTAALVVAAVLCSLLAPLQAAIAAGPTVDSVTGSLDDSWASDEVSLLQAELILKATSAKAATEPEFFDEDHVCPATSGDCGACSDAEGRGAGFAPARPETFGEPALLSPVPRAAAEGKTAPSKVFRYILDALVVMIVLDGVRRWRQKAEVEPVADDERDFAALLEAILAGDATSCEALIQAAPSVDGADLWGCTLLHAAARSGLAPVVKTLLQRGAGVDQTDVWDETPLHLAARAGHGEVCDLLLACGATIDAVNAQEWTPLAAAAEAGWQGVCDMLLSRGAGVAGLSHADLPPMLAGVMAKQVVEEDGAAWDQSPDSPDYYAAEEEVEPTWMNQ